jgi:gliding motility-associated-like protein
MKLNNIVVIALMIVQTTIRGQITITTAVTQNYHCNGVGCNYTGPSILINEVMLCPSVFDGSMYGDGPGFTPNTNSGEWIELYNPDQCYPKDISGFLLGNNAPESGVNYGGGFVIPPNTIVPSRGFCVIRGTNATPVPSGLLIQNGGNTIEIVVNSTNSCIDGGYRLWFPNAGGWFAFYDQQGNPQDAISWASTSNSCNSCNPCIPPSSSYSSTLPSYDAIPASMKTYISANPPTSGYSFRRIPDGGNWQTSFPGSPTLGTCNDTCVPPAMVTCNGTAEVIPSGGAAPYSYFWNGGSSPLNSLDSGLCSGIYLVTVTDNNGITATASVDIPNWVPSSSFTLFPDTFCSNNGSTATYTGDASDPAVFAWSAADASITPGTGAGPHVVSSDAPGNHVVSLAVSQNGCQSLPTQHSFYLYSIGATIATTATPVCYHSLTGGLNATGNSGIIPYHYEWSNGVLDPDNPNIIAGNYTVTVTDAIGCTASASVSLPDQTPIVAIVNATSETCLNVCDGAAEVSASGSVPPYVYHWQNNSSTTTSAIGYCSGNYSVTITDANNCISVSDFSVTPIAELSASAVANPSIAVAPADIQFSFIGIGATTYFWQFGDGSNSTLINPIHNYENPGVYTVTLVVTNGPPNYCTDSTAIQVEIVPPSNVTIPNVFTPNSDGVNDRFYALSEGIDFETMNIFNRWGRLIFTSVNVSEPWIGKDSNGMEVADGVYFYVYSAIGFDKKEYNLHGSVTLLR